MKDQVYLFLKSSTKTSVWIHDIIQIFSQYGDLHQLLQEQRLTLLAPFPSRCDPDGQLTVPHLSEEDKTKKKGINLEDLYILISTQIRKVS